MLIGAADLPVSLYRTSGCDRFQCVQQRGLHHAVPHGRNTQRSPLHAARFRYPDAPHGLRAIRIGPQRRVQLIQLLLAIRQKALHRLMVHSRRPLVADHMAAGDKQVQRCVHLVNQRVPSSSSHSLFECRQHAFRPDARVCPVALRRRLSGGGSRERHCRRLLSFPWFGHHASIFLHPFAPPALPGFVATMGALTPGQPALRILIRDHEHRPLSAQVSLFTTLDLPTIPSSTTVLPFPQAAFARYLGRMGRRVYPPGRPGRVAGNAVGGSPLASPPGLSMVSPEPPGAARSRGRVFRLRTGGGGPGNRPAPAASAPRPD